MIIPSDWVKSSLARGRSSTTVPIGSLGAEGLGLARAPPVLSASGSSST